MQQHERVRSAVQSARKIIVLLPVTISWLFSYVRLFEAGVTLSCRAVLSAVRAHRERQLLQVRLALERVRRCNDRTRSRLQVIGVG